MLSGRNNYLCPGVFCEVFFCLALNFKITPTIGNGKIYSHCFFRSQNAPTQMSYQANMKLIFISIFIYVCVII